MTLCPGCHRYTETTYWPGTPTVPTHSHPGPHALALLPSYWLCTKCGWATPADEEEE